MTLSACGAAQQGAPMQAALPTANVIPQPSQSARVIPLTFTPVPKQAKAIPTELATTTKASDPVVSVTVASAPITPTPSDSAAPLEAELIVEINKVRRANGLPSYQVSPELGAAARAHSCDLATHHLISHVSSDGRALTERLAGSEPPWEWSSESIAAGSDDPATIVAWWMDEPPDGWHRRNILDEQQQAVGAGYCFTEDDPTGNHFYWTADFARRATQP
jgi:uncharacterized protein YkwD